MRDYQSRSGIEKEIESTRVPKRLTRKLYMYNKLYYVIISVLLYVCYYKCITVRRKSGDERGKVLEADLE